MMVKCGEVKYACGSLVDVSGLLENHNIPADRTAKFLDIVGVPSEDDAGFFEIWACEDNFFFVHIGFLKEFLELVEIPDNNGLIVKAAKDMVVEIHIEMAKKQAGELEFHNDNLAELVYLHKEIKRLSAIDSKTISNCETTMLNCTISEASLIGMFG